MVFTDQLPFDEVDVIFFCFGHGKSAEFLQAHDVPSRVKIIDLAQDFRLAAPGNDYVYGLPESNSHCQKAQHVANQLFLPPHPVRVTAPLAATACYDGDVSVNAITGSTGAG